MSDVAETVLARVEGEIQSVKKLIESADKQGRLASLVEFRARWHQLESVKVWFQLAAKEAK